VLSKFNITLSALREATGALNATVARADVNLLQEILARRTIKRARTLLPEPQLINVFAGVFHCEYLFAMLVAYQEEPATQALVAFGLDLKAMVLAVQASRLPEVQPTLISSPSISSLIELAKAEAADLDQPLSSAHLLLAIVCDGMSVAARVLGQHGVAPDRLREAIRGLNQA
jgi:ATP-dependent Clp protease ATP-binding subunit ClpA